MVNPGRRPSTHGNPLPQTMTHLLQQLQAFFTASHCRAYLVGGCLRDSLLGLSTRDVDLAVEGDALFLARRLADSLGGAFVALGEEHQVARIVLRPPGEGEWRIDLASLRGSLEEDLGYRDFTLDALALPLEYGGVQGWETRLTDPFGGRGDLEQRRVRAVSDRVFQEDPLRLLRAVRVAAQRGLSIEEATLALIRRHAPLLPTVAAERVRDEFLGILAAEGVREHLGLLDSLGLLCRVLPELEVTRGVSQPKEHYWDVFEHSLEAAGAAERVTGGDRRDPVVATVPWDQRLSQHFAQEVSDGHTRRTLLKLAALLHDVAKPQTKTVDEKGRTRFFGHQAQGAAITREVLERLRLSGRGVHLVGTMVEYHLRPVQMSQGGELATSRAVYRYFRDLGDAAVETLYLSLADYLAARGPNLELEDWGAYVRMMAHILSTGLEEQAPERRPKLLSGHDLIQLFGLAPGPELGQLLEALREAQAAGEVATQEEALAWVRRQLGRRGQKPAAKGALRSGRAMERKVYTEG
ncbi:MAG: CCA tRNA nucleotidyltransferase [Dehalococcoidia bacterium]